MLRGRVVSTGVKVVIRMTDPSGSFILDRVTRQKKVIKCTVCQMVISVLENDKAGNGAIIYWDCCSVR